MPRHFRKVVLSTQIKFQGKPILWEPISSDAGVRVFHEEVDAPIIAELDRLADARRGGVTRISAEIYENLKKNRTSQPSQPQPTVFEKLRIADREAVLVKPNPKPSESSVPPAPVVSAPPKPVAPAPIAPTGQQQKPGQIYDNHLGKFVDPEPAAAPLRKFTPRKAKKSAVEKTAAAPLESDKVAT